MCVSVRSYRGPYDGASTGSLGALRALRSWQTRFSCWSSGALKTNKTNAVKARVLDLDLDLDENLNLDCN